MITNVKLEGDFLVFDVNLENTLKILLDGEITMRKEGKVVTYTTGSYTISHESDSPYDDDDLEWSRKIEIKNEQFHYEDEFLDNYIERALANAVRSFQARP